MGQVARLDLDLCEEFVHCVLPLAEQFQNPDPRRMAQRAEEVRLGLIERSRHVASRRLR
jgi:hypothetical protein